MVIRDLYRDVGDRKLTMFWGGNGDVYVNIYQDDGTPVSVRIGMAGSGMHLPGLMGELFAQLATEFEKYSEYENEWDAYTHEFLKYIKAQKEHEQN